jgi:ribose-phosphate pyrophosphokinase
MIVPGSTSQSLAAALASETGRELATVDYQRFPDGELLAAVPALANRDVTDVVIVAATTSSDAHVELLQLQDAASEADVEHVTTVLPYMGYARQDAAFDPGQPISARAVARAISTGTDRVVLVNPHEPAVVARFGVPAETVDACPRLAEPLPDDLSDPLFLAPDDGAIRLAASVRDAYGRGDTDYFEKTRLSGTEVTIEPSDAVVEGRDVVVVDDIVATGSTMSEAIALLRERGAERVLAACIHPVLARSARTRLARAGVEAVVGTDTVERAVSAVSAAPVVAEVL